MYLYFDVMFFLHRTVPVEEREAKYIRFISGSFSMMKYIFEMISEKLNKSANDDLENLFKEKKFWKFVKHKASLVSYCGSDQGLGYLCILALVGKLFLLQIYMALHKKRGPDVDVKNVPVF